MTDEQTRAWIRRWLELHAGNLRAVTEELGMPREAITRILAGINVRPGTMALARQQITQFDKKGMKAK